MTIIVNGLSKSLDSATYLAYEDVVQMAGASGSPTVTYRLEAPNGSRSGSMHAGLHVRVEDGMVFNVVHMDKA